MKSGSAQSLLLMLLMLLCPLQARAQDPHRGGTLRLLAASGMGTIDPQVNYQEKYFQLCQSIYDGLLAFRKVAGEGAFTLVPDLAETLPTVSDGGKTYVFHLRHGIQFSDGHELGVDDVVASYTRLFKVSSPTAGTWYRTIVGAEACLKKPASCTLAGGVQGDTKAATVTFHLVNADPEFLYKVASPHAVILPAATAARDTGVQAPPGTGPYRIASYDPRKQLKLVRNPRFKVWSGDAQPDGYADEVDYDFGLPDEDQVTAIENGQADWSFDAVPVDRLNEIGTRYAAQVHVSPLKALYYLALNTRRAPFNSLQARQALNFALDRRALVRIYGGPKLATPTCQFLPPGFPGHEAYCPYSKPPGAQWAAPDMERARQLVKASGTAGQKVTLVVQDTAMEIQLGTYVQSVLNDLGYVATVKSLASSVQFIYIQNTNNEVQISISDWYQDYPTASDFLHVNFACDSFHPGSDVSVNISGLCDAGLDADMQRAMLADVDGPDATNRLWAAIDHRIVDLAPVAPMFNPQHIDFLSKRVKNFVYSDRFYWLYAQSWVQ